MWGKWKYAEQILVLEARVLVMSLRRIALTRFGHDIRQLLLCDNMSVVLAFCRSRSSCFALLVQIRIFSAYCLARGIYVSVRWIPSELNVSDRPSRAFDNAESKLLVDHVDTSWLDHDHDLPRSLDVPHTKPHADPCLSQPLETTCLRDSSFGSTDAVVSEQAKQEEASYGGSGVRDGSSAEGKEEDFDGDHSSGKAVEEEAGGGVGTAGDLLRAASQDPDQDQDKSKDCRRLSGQQPRKRLSQLELIDIRERARCKRRQRETQKIDSTSSEPQVQVLGAEFLRSAAGTDAFGKGYVTAEGALVLSKILGWSDGVPNRTSNAFRIRSGSRCHDHSVFQPGVSQRVWKPRRREGVGGISGPQSFVWPAGEQEDPEVLEESQGLEASYPWKVEAGFPMGSVVRHRLSDGSERAQAEGNLLPDVGGDVCTAQPTARNKEDVLGATLPWRDSALVSGHVSRRVWRNKQDRHPRRLRNSGQPSWSVVESCASPVAGRRCRPACVELRLRRVQQCVSPSCSGLECSCYCPLCEAQRAQHRSVAESEEPGRNPKAGAVEVQEQHLALRKSRKAGNELAKTASDDQRLLPRVRAQHRKFNPRPRMKKELAFDHKSDRLRSGINGNVYVADFFAGKGGVARAIRATGFSTREWELLHGPDYDLTQPATIKRILGDIQNRRLLSAMFAPPCSSFSVARDRTLVIRDRAYPWGRPNLPEHEQAKIEVGNKCFRATLKIIRALDFFGIPWILENPWSSKCWRLPPIVKLMSMSHVHLRVGDFCSWGTPWRKRTTFMCGNISNDDSMRLQRLCTGERGICGRTGSAHVHLTGSKNGTPLTQIAQPYPPKLCHDLAHVLVSHAKYNN